MNILFEISVRPVDDFFTAEYAIPDEVPGATSALLGVLFPFVVEVEADLGVNAHTEVVVHHAFLFKVVPGEE